MVDSLTIPSKYLAHVLDQVLVHAQVDDLLLKLRQSFLGVQQLFQSFLQLIVFYD